MKKPSGSKASGPMPIAQNGANHLRIVLELSGRLISFKTGKRGALQRSKRGKLYARPLTKPAHAKQMREWIEAIKSQLRCAMAREMGQIPTEHAHPCLIASSGPAGRFADRFDDRRQFVRRLVVDWISVNAGDEGAKIVITPL
jgi:hypothetical protein